MESAVTYTTRHLLFQRTVYTVPGAVPGAQAIGLGRKTILLISLPNSILFLVIVSDFGNEESTLHAGSM